MKEQIEKAIETAAFRCSYHKSRGAIHILEVWCTIHEVLKLELDRLENKPLTIEQLQGMIGEPVWVEVIIQPDYTFFRTGYGLVCETRRKKFCILQDYDMVSLNNATIIDLVGNGTIKIYKHKPEKE